MTPACEGLNICANNGLFLIQKENVIMKIKQKNENAHVLKNGVEITARKKFAMMDIALIIVNIF